MVHENRSEISIAFQGFTLQVVKACRRNILSAIRSVYLCIEKRCYSFVHLKPSKGLCLLNGFQLLSDDKDAYSPGKR